MEYHCSLSAQLFFLKGLVVWSKAESVRSDSGSEKNLKAKPKSSAPRAKPKASAAMALSFKGKSRQGCVAFPF